MMFVFAVVALRLLGLWLKGTSAPSAIFVIFTAAGLLNLQTDPMTIAYRAAFSGTPVILGVLILFFSRLLAMLIVPKTHEPLPQAPSERVFTQLSLIVIGVFALVRAIPAIGGRRTGTGR